MTPAQALADAFHLLPVADLDGHATVVDGDALIALLAEPGGYVAVRHRLVFAGMAEGRTPEEALAGLLSPVGARVGSVR